MNEAILRTIKNNPEMNIEVTVRPFPPTDVFIFIIYLNY